MSNTPVDKIMDMISWTPTGAADEGSGLPYATHTGAIEIAGVVLRCYQLNTGQRLIDTEDMARFFGMFGEGAEDV